MRTLLVLLTLSALLSGAAFSVRAQTEDVSTGVAELQLSNLYVYQRNGETDSHTPTAQVDIYKSYGSWTPEALVLTSIDGRADEQELNLYYDTARHTSLGDIKFEGTIGAWNFLGGQNIPLYGEISRDWTLNKGTVTLTPFVGFGQWFGFGVQRNLGYVQGGVRLSTQLSSRISFSAEGAVSQCLKEEVQLSSSECRTVPYANLETGYDLGKAFTVLARAQVTGGAESLFAVVLQRKF